MVFDSDLTKPDNSMSFVGQESFLPAIALEDSDHDLLYNLMSIADNASFPHDIPTMMYQDSAIRNRSCAIEWMKKVSYALLHVPYAD